MSQRNGKPRRERIEPEIRVLCVQRALATERMARRHPGAFCIPLGANERPFWSKGWKGCPMDCGQSVTATPRLTFRITQQYGYTTRGWYCR